MVNLSSVSRDHLSHLTRSRPLLVRCEQPSMEDRSAGVHARQIIMEFDMDTWKVGSLELSREY